MSKRKASDAKRTPLRVDATSTHIEASGLQPYSVWRKLNKGNRASWAREMLERMQASWQKLEPSKRSVIRAELDYGASVKRISE